MGHNIWMPSFDLERLAWENGFSRVAGVDEVGRGPWAGPVLACAIIFNSRDDQHPLFSDLDDSKKLSKIKREKLAQQIPSFAKIGIGYASVKEIDAFNILRATLVAMGRAIDDLPETPDYILVDGTHLPNTNFEEQSVIRGDSRSFSIAAASVIAKVKRDNLMSELSLECPGYGWETNAGYGTKIHKEALERQGITKHHRKSFSPIRNMLMK